MHTPDVSASIPEEQRDTAGSAVPCDPAEQHPFLRWCYRGWHPTRLGRWLNRVQGWWSGLGLPPDFQVLLEVRGRVSGRRRATPVVVTTVAGGRYLVSMLGPRSEWVKNVAAADGAAWLLFSGLVVLPYLTYDTHTWRLWISFAEYLPLYALLGLAGVRRARLRLPGRAVLARWTAPPVEAFRPVGPE